MNDRLALIGGIGLGAGLMYLFDPDRGERRRKLLGDQVVSMLSQSDDVAGKTGRDLRNRARGLVAETRARLSREEVTDEVLRERVRSKLGWVVSHPSAIEVAVDQGRVTLSGPILAHEVEDLLASVAAVQGVKDVENQLEVHEQPGDVPGLQGGRQRTGEKFELMQTYWSPTARLLMGSAGGALVAAGVRQRGISGGVLGALGLGMHGRSITNMEMKRLLGVGGGRRGIDIQKTIIVGAPVEEVFDYWTDVSNFPRFMEHVRAVKDLGNGRSHWVVTGPAGKSISWDSVVTTLTPNEELAWKSMPGASIPNAGIIRFATNADGSTRLDITITYNPPGGIFGHLLARLFGADPKSQLDDSLVRFKSLIEIGKTTAHDETVTREEMDFSREMDRESGLQMRERGAETDEAGS